MAKKTEQKNVTLLEQPKITADCPICEHILGACEKEGNKEFCQQLIDLFKKKKIDSNDFIVGLEKKFNKDIRELMSI